MELVQIGKFYWKVLRKLQLVNYVPTIFFAFYVVIFQFSPPGSIWIRILEPLARGPLNSLAVRESVFWVRTSTSIRFAIVT